MLKFNKICCELFCCNHRLASPSCSRGSTVTLGRTLRHLNRIFMREKRMLLIYENKTCF